MNKENVFKIFLFLLIIFFMHEIKINAIAPQEGVGGYHLGYNADTGIEYCKTYPDIRININNPSSSSNLSSAYCIEEGVEYIRPWANGMSNFQECEYTNYLDNTCASQAAAYFGVTEGGSNFWAAQTILNGKYFYYDSDCENFIDWNPLLQRGYAYCTPITLNSVSMMEGDTVTITNSSIGEYNVESSSSNLTVSKNGNSITITATSPGTGTIKFSRGTSTPVKAFCDNNYQNLLVSLTLPYMSTTMTVNVEAGTHYGRLIVSKVDSSNSSIKLSGAVFKVCTNYTMTENCVQKTTGTDGTFTTSDYELPQTIYVQELTAPSKYNIDSTSITAVTLSENTPPLIVTDTKKRGYLLINKIDKNHTSTKLSDAVIKVCTNSSMTNDCETLRTTTDGTVRTVNTYPLDTVLYYQEITAPSGYRTTPGIANKTITTEGVNSVTIENVKTQMVKIKKVDSEMPSILLSGAKFKVCENESMTDRCLPNLLETGLNGETDEIGPYDEGTVLWIQEMLAPEYYYLDSASPQRIVVGTEDIIKSFTDTIKKSTFKLVKKDSVNSEILLEGAKYKVCMNESMTSNCMDYITNSNGTFTTSEYRINTNLYYQEIEAPNNYQIDNNVYRINLSEEGINTKVVTDVLKRGYLKIAKTTTDNTPISGTTFRIGTKLDGIQGSDWDYYTTDENGFITLPDAPVGTLYNYVEIDTPRGFINDNIKGTALITNTLDTNDIQEKLVTITNEYVKGIIKIYKVDKNYKPLKGVQFKIGTNLDGIQGVDFDYYYTNESGEAIAEDLFLNVNGDTVYKAQEIETLPGYILDNTVHEFSLNVEYTNNSNFSSLLIINNAAVPLKEVKIFKQVRGTNDPIKDVKINVYKKDGTLYREVKTDEKGEAQVELEKGDYYFEEVETPTGYKKINGKVKFSIKGTNTELSTLSLAGDNEEYVEVVIYNDIINVKTGTFNILIPFLIVLICSPVIFIYLKKHQKLA